MDNGTRFIGLAITAPEVAFEAARDSGLNGSWFGQDWQSEAWRALCDMSSSASPIDPVFLLEHANRGDYRLCKEEIDRAVSGAPSGRDCVDRLIQGIREEYVARELERISCNMYRSTDPIKTAADLSMELMEIAGTHQKGESKASILGDIRKQWRDSLAGSLPGLPMPWSGFNHKVGGPRKKMVTTLVGHGGSGKSSAFLQWALYLGSKGIPCAVFPFEDGVQLAYERMAGMVAEVPIFGIHIGRGTVDHVERLEEALEYVSQLPIHLSARRGNMGEIQIEAQQMKARHGIEAVFLDSFKDVRRQRDGIEGDNEVMEGVVTMAHRLDVPVIMGHHVRKAPSALKAQTWDSWNITKDDLRGSGRIWDDSRSVIALQMYPDGEAWQYFFHQLKSNHGIAGVRQPIERKPWMCWKEIDVVDMVDCS